MNGWGQKERDEGVGGVQFRGRGSGVGLYLESVAKTVLISYQIFKELIFLSLLCLRDKISISS